MVLLYVNILLYFSAVLPDSSNMAAGKFTPLGKPCGCEVKNRESMGNPLQDRDVCIFETI